MEDTEEDTTGLALLGAARATSSLLVLIRPRQETGKVQAGVKKAQGGSSRISLTSRPVQPQHAPGTALPCWGCPATTTKPSLRSSRSLSPAGHGLCWPSCLGGLWESSPCPAPT